VNWVIDVLAPVGAAFLATVIFLTLYVIACQVARARRGHRTPAPGPAAGPPVSHAAAPVPGHGGTACSIRVWKCGRTRIWDQDGTLVYRCDCTCPPLIDWDRHERELRQ